MAGNLEGFDASQVDPNVGFDPVPKGDYTAIATASEFKETKAKDGSEYLQFDWEIIEGQYKGRMVFDRLNLKNDNETAVKIAQGTLSAICHAVGIMKPKDSSELHGKPVNISVDLEERNDKPGSYSNRIKGYSAIGGKKPETEAKSNGGNGDSKKPPWKK